jgi:hypothetical protein
LNAFAEAHAISERWQAEFDTVFQASGFRALETVFGTESVERPHASKDAKKRERAQPVSRTPKMKLRNEPTILQINKAIAFLFASRKGSQLER